MVWIILIVLFIVFCGLLLLYWMGKILMLGYFFFICFMKFFECLIVEDVFVMCVIILIFFLLFICEVKVLVVWVFVLWLLVVIKFIGMFELMFELKVIILILCEFVVFISGVSVFVLRVVRSKLFGFCVIVFLINWICLVICVLLVGLI